MRELLTANKIAWNFNNKLKIIKIKYFQAWLPVNIINDVSHRFNRGKNDVLITWWLFGEMKQHLIRLLFVCAN